MAVHRRRAGWAVNNKNLRDFFPDLEPEARAALIDLRDDAPELFLRTANKILEGYGTEVVRSEKHWDSYYGDIVAEYVNTGDTYNATILHDIERGNMYVTTLGDWVEVRGDTLWVV